jgi:uncharacterized membrane protein YkgB
MKEDDSLNLEPAARYRLLRKILIVVVAAIILLCLIPPWISTHGVIGGYVVDGVVHMAVGYSPIFVPPDGAVVDLARLAVEIVMVFASGALVYLLKLKKPTGKPPTEATDRP